MMNKDVRTKSNLKRSGMLSNNGYFLFSFLSEQNAEVSADTRSLNSKLIKTGKYEETWFGILL